MAEQEFKYLAIKNWRKFQPKDSKTLPWIRDYKEKETDMEYARLTCFQRYLFDAICRLRGRLSHNVHNDATYIARAIHTLPTDRPHIAHALHTLISRGLLVLCNEQNTPLGEVSKGEVRGGEEIKIATSPEPQTSNEELSKDLPTIALAQKVAGELCLEGRGIIGAIAGAIDFCVKFEEMTRNSAVDFLISKAREEIGNARAPNKFWFDDRKWRQAGSAGKKSNLRERLDGIDKMEF